MNSLVNPSNLTKVVFSAIVVLLCFCPITTTHGATVRRSSSTTARHRKKDSDGLKHAAVDTIQQAVDQEETARGRKLKKSKKSKSSDSDKKGSGSTKETKPKEKVNELSNVNFLDGTFRITEPGYYKLTEDIDFGPQESNDYWPLFSQWQKYPPSAYYLGFFAAITIETDDVVIDLNGFEIRQNAEFYLAQRFFNVIELNDRVFIQNNGVSPLNYQKTDEPVKGLKAGQIVQPSNIVIKNGSLGRSSHAGIHGNGITGLIVEDVHIYDFEVAGIHCNGCKDVTVRNTEVGPGARNVPVIATFSNARFIDFFAKRLIPFGFQREKMSMRQSLQALFDSSITFSDRPSQPMTLNEVFNRLSRGIDLFRSKIQPTDPSDTSLLEEAKSIFGNPSGLTDGSVIYGIFFNRLGLPETDENFHGAGRETQNIVLEDIKVHGLHINPIEVAALMTEEGAFMQGPARDLLRIYDITTDSMRSLENSFYKGNFLADAYFALWKLSNEFYRIRVFDSECGNFGSNATFPMNLKLYPSHNEPTCAQLGTWSDSSLSGREITMLQKRYFGGLQLSQGLFDWATTKGKGLESLLSSPSSADSLRNGGRHRLVCGHDTMFHPMQGSVGVKFVEARDVTINNVEVSDLINIGDVSIWVCRHKWQVQPSSEEIKAYTADLNSEQAAMVRGFKLVRTDKVRLTDVHVHQLVSEEGSVFAFDIVGDTNDRTDHSDDTGVSFKDVSIEKLSAPREVEAVKNTGTPFDASNGINVGVPDEIQTNLKNPRVILNYQHVNAGPFTTYTNQTSLELLMKTTSFDTEEKVRAFRGEIMGFYSVHYGLRFEADANNKYNLLEAIPVLDRNGEVTDSVISGLYAVQNDVMKYHGSSMCLSDASGQSSKCTSAGVYPLHDFGFLFSPGPTGFTLHGAFGKDQGQLITQGSLIATGVYSFEGFNLPGSILDGSNLEIKYFGECPLDYRPVKTGALGGLYISCAVESNIFGKGIATGGFLHRFNDDFSQVMVSGYPTMIFDDFVHNPKSIPVRTNYQHYLIPSIQHNDIRISYVADGTFKTLLSGVEALPFIKAQHYTNEAVIEYFKFRTSLQTEEKILALRKQFLERLRDEFGIVLINPDAYDEIPLDGVIDLGGGTHITGYVVNEDANQRVLTRQSEPNGHTTVFPSASFLHEGGFRLVVGRAGLNTVDGRSPFGTTIQEGIYVMENGDSTMTTNVEMPFHSLALVDLNSWSTSVIYNYVQHPEYGEGRVLTAQPMPLVGSDGIHLKISGSLVFGNV
jgi:hypothetical protein